MTWLAGSHLVKAGTDINYVSIDETVGLNQTGGFTIAGTSTDNVLETLSVGGPTPNRFDSPSVTYLRQVGSLGQSMSSPEVAAFVQDSWRIGEALTLTYGLRWEGQWHPSPDVSNHSLVDRLTGFTFPIGTRVDPAVVPDSLNQIAPRVGVAWVPGEEEKTVLRGNAGIYYARTPGIILAGPLGNFAQPPGDLSVLLPFAVPASNPNKTVYQQLALIGIDLNRVPLSELPIITPAQIEQVIRALGLAFDPYTGAQLFVVDPDFRNPKSYQWGFGAERVFAAGLTAGAEYVDVRAVNLERNIDLNLPVPMVRSNDEAQRPFSRRVVKRSCIPRPGTSNRFRCSARPR